jgi:hypothetical protein
VDIWYQPITGVPAPHTTAWVDDVLDTLPGAVGALISRGLTMTPQGICGAAFSFWSDADGDADRSPRLGSIAGSDSSAGASGSDRSRPKVALGEPRRYKVVRAQQGWVPSAASYLQITTFDGPRGSAWGTAFERASRERIEPVVLSTPGIAAVLRCRAGDGSALALTLAASVESLEAALEAVMSTELLPGEDPAMLTGPDRVDVHRLLHADLPDPARPASPVLVHES